MWHKVEVYAKIHHPFTLAVIEYGQIRKKNVGNADMLWQRHRNEIADEVVRNARIPSLGSARAVKEYAMRPWKGAPKYTRDDGVADMTVGEIKRICLDWIEENEGKL